MTDIMLARKIYSKIRKLYRYSLYNAKALVTGRLWVQFPASVRMRSPMETLDDVERWIVSERRGAYLRFGDGDVNLLHGIDDLLQRASPKFMLEMKESFALGGSGIFKCLPLHSRRFGMEADMKPGFHSSADDWAIRELRMCFEYFIGDRIYSHVALSHVANSDKARAVEFLKLLKSHKPVFVGNRDVTPTLLEKVMAARCHVKTDPAYSYKDIDRAERETLDAVNSASGDFVLVIVAMGCAGRVLEKRILNGTKKNVFLFDFGSLLDLLCGWETRAWMRKDLSERDAEYWKSLVDSL